MKYYFFDPFRRQYYFPEGYKKYSLFKGFYQPYTLKGRLLWILWSKIPLIRAICVENNLEEVLPLNNIKKYLKENSISVFNRGTPGHDQKITVLSIDLKTREEVFIKYAATDVARKNVRNEGAVLNQLNHLGFVPKIIKNVINNTYTLIITDVLKGERFKSSILDERILNILFQLSKQELDIKKKSYGKLKTCFAHGDFCPWNMMEFDGSIKVFDWEMAGVYPLGYDLFTFIFQTSFLLYPKKKSEDIIQEMNQLISTYFSEFGIDNWISYLLCFATIKYSNEKNKSNHDLIKPYFELKSYAEKI